jgi:hypothetical protein
MLSGHRKLEQLFGMRAELHQRRVRHTRRRGRRDISLSQEAIKKYPITAILVREKIFCGRESPQRDFFLSLPAIRKTLRILRLVHFTLR